MFHKKVFYGFIFRKFASSNLELACKNLRKLQTLEKVLSQIVNDIETAGAATLEYFIETIASDPSKEKPNDGNVHEAASNAFLFLEQLQEKRFSVS